MIYSTNAIRTPKDDSDKVYPCRLCGILRSKNQGGTTFTLCDDCWDKTMGRKVSAPPAPESGR